MQSMNDILVPRWIKKIEAESELEKAQADANARQQALIALTIRTEGPEFWRQLLKELAISAESLSRIGLRGSLSQVTKPESEVEEGYQFNVALLDVSPKQTYTNIFYTKGSNLIRCHTRKGESFRLYLCVPSESGIGVVSDKHVEPMTTAERVAQFIVEPMVDMVRS